ncbi:hypothetical protein [Herpetosiphon llansteffanensis]|uniref:hypothetical protein n=1 Tax=Herpetosiphon llansteffanensis TaxID=2094568 RepID=UPI000D7C0262|nr:hypothetical protein [Herpetosiphon llansteffanensis]
MKKRYVLLWLSLLGGLMLLGTASPQPHVTIGELNIPLWHMIMAIVLIMLSGFALRFIAWQYHEYRTLYNHPPTHLNQWPNDPLPSKPSIR